jgi:hypothetical protein
MKPRLLSRRAVVGRIGGLKTCAFGNISAGRRVTLIKELMCNGEVSAMITSLFK